MNDATPDRSAFEARLRRIGAERYHDKHPFHALLHGGGCTIDQVRAWVINRYYYQSRIPMKDAAFMSRVEDPRLRRGQRHRRGQMTRWCAWSEILGEGRAGTVQRTGGIMPAAESTSHIITFCLEH